MSYGIALWQNVWLLTVLQCSFTPTMIFPEATWVAEEGDNSHLTVEKSETHTGSWLTEGRHVLELANTGLSPPFSEPKDSLWKEACEMNEEMYFVQSELLYEAPIPQRFRLKRLYTEHWSIGSTVLKSLESESTKMMAYIMGSPYAVFT